MIKVLLVIGSAVLSAALVLTVFFRVDFKGGRLLIPRFPLGVFSAQIPKQLVPMGIFIVFIALTVPLRAIQWQRTLKRRVPFAVRYHLTAIGGLLQNVLPGKLGDVARAFLLARKEGIPFVESLGSVAVCKLLELAALLVLCALVLVGPLRQAMPAFAHGLSVASAVCAGLVVVVFLLARYSAQIAHALARRHWRRLESFFNNVSAGLSSLRSAKKLAVACALSAAPIISMSLGYGEWLEALSAQGGLAAGVLVLGAMTLGQSTLGVPAAMGTSFVVANWSARILGVRPEDAAAFSTLMTIATAATHTLIGLISVWLGSVRWEDLRPSGRMTADTSSA